MRNGYVVAPGDVYEHVLVAERALGKPLPPGAEVHHVNGDRTDPRPSNLVVCQDHAYHCLLHRRARAFRACGHVDWRWCRFCRRWDAPENLYLKPGGGARHRECFNRYHLEWVRKRRGPARATTSRVAGVCFVRAKNRWRAELWRNKRNVFRGFFRTEDEAIAARRDAERRYLV